VPKGVDVLSVRAFAVGERRFLLGVLSSAKSNFRLMDAWGLNPERLGSY
jgi:hypothetical protein